jgi:hypothetical protein
MILSAIVVASNVTVWSALVIVIVLVSCEPL